MAQLNPNFEIDFGDINSYEQIQLINDTQLAKENLLLQRAYKEPADDEIIKNHFSSFTFVDFCPKFFISHPDNGDRDGAAPAGGQNKPPVGQPCYELENFSDLFERINVWLKLNKDWRVVSMQTLIYDSASKFNHQKQSVYSSYLPQNTRGLRLFLCPSRSRFSGHQKIGCINVVPRKVAGSYMNPDEPVAHETLDQILGRLNELLMKRPIEGKILSVETITLPMVNGYVDTETNYLIDSQLSALHEAVLSSEPPGQQQPAGMIRDAQLIDVLRVYYEFGPVKCGLVNLIDFIPKVYVSNTRHPEPEAANQEAEPPEGVASPLLVPKAPPTESLTRLIRRSLAWFEAERKRILHPVADQAEGAAPLSVNLKMCNLQVHYKTLTKGQLLRMDPDSVVAAADTRSMTHTPISARLPDSCALCGSGEPSLCAHAAELLQPFELKFVRLAYVVPVDPSGSAATTIPRGVAPVDVPPDEADGLGQEETDSSCSEASRSQSVSSTEGSRPEVATVEGCIDSRALSLLAATNERHIRAEQRHQCNAETDIGNGPIGQLTYRLFAPCQLVNSSSCFSINPINPSSPLSHRGSVILSCQQEEAANEPTPSAASRLSVASVGLEQLSVHLLASSPFGAPLASPSSEPLYHGGQGGRQQSACGQPAKPLASEFESVDSMRRRMEVYVTTNSMKVLAGETMIVNLSDSLACLSTTIEQTLSRATRGASRPPTNWVTVYIIYAAVEEPQIPSQLLAQQRQSDQLALGRPAASAQEVPHFDDDFGGPESVEPTPSASGPLPEVDLSRIRVEHDPVSASLTLYNSAYDRTVALPTPPDQPDESDCRLATRLVAGDHALLGSHEPLDQRPFSEKRKLRGKGRRARRRLMRMLGADANERQCSIM